MRLLGASERLEWLYDRAVVLHHYRKVFGRSPNLVAPVTFNEKTIYRILFDRRPMLTMTSDRVAVRQYVSRRIGEEYLPKLYNVFVSADDIEQSKLPNSFALKASQASGRNMLVPDKARWNLEDALPTLRAPMRN